MHNLQKETFKSHTLMVFDQDYASLLERQIGGEPILFIGHEDVEHFARNVSTDHILPSIGGRFRSPEDLGIYALSGLAGISQGTLKEGQFGTLVVGQGFGSGSAREHAPRALIGAGVQNILVLGQAERIFKENCLYVGGPHIYEVSPNSDELNTYIAQINNNEPLSASEVFDDPLRIMIRDSGGLFEFTKKRLNHEVELPVISHPEYRFDHPMTATEKILRNHIKNVDPNSPVIIPGDIGFVDLDLRFSYEFHTKMMIDDLIQNFGPNFDDLIKNKDSFMLFEDHLVYAEKPQFTQLIEDQRKISKEQNIRLFRQKEGLKGTIGICHTLIPEKGLLLPGQIAIGTDSHTCSAGVLGSIAFGVGATAMANSLLTKDTLVEVPQTVKINLEGKLHQGSTAKDVMLYLLANPYVRQNNCIGKVLEYTGSGISDWSLDQLFVLTNMAVEGGATTGIIPEPTRAVIDQLHKSTGIPEDEIRGLFQKSDTGASFAHTISINLSEIEPMVATPGNPMNGVQISQLGSVEVNKAYIGSCTGGNISDLRAAAEVLKGKSVKIPLFVQAASMEVYNQAQNEGLIDVIEKAGAEFLLPGCGACIGMGPGKGESDSDRIISDTNRNFRGRMGKGDVYLASPYIVAASCITGTISIPH